MGYMGDVKTKTFIDDNASSATSVAAAAQPTSTFTLAATSFVQIPEEKLRLQLLEQVIMVKQLLLLEQM